MSAIRVSRDEIVARGYQAEADGSIAHTPWMYSAKVKSGTRATRNVTGTYYSIRHLMGSIVERHAREGETLHVFGITRVMKSQLRSMREDI